MKENKPLRKITSLFSNFLIAVLFILAFFLVGIKLFGFMPYSVLSGSMEPTFPTGSMIYVKEVDAISLEEGDIITFKLSGQTPITHRIVKIVNHGENHEFSFQTKGDSNNMVDGNLVKADQVIGKAMFCIPYLGYLSGFIKTPLGLMIICFSVLLTVVGTLMGDLSKNKDEEENQ